MLLYYCMLPPTFMLLYQKRGSAAVMKLFNRLHKSKKKTRPNSAAPPPYRELFTQIISRFSDPRSLCWHLVEIEDLITEGP